jgi:hypothetical protein
MTEKKNEGNHNKVPALTKGEALDLKKFFPQQTQIEIELALAKM